MQGSDSVIAALTLVVTAIIDPFAGLMTGAVLKFVLPLIGLGV
jgi:AGZA family xanthine/uracil permease-like MFS transporter